MKGHSDCLVGNSLRSGSVGLKCLPISQVELCGIDHYIIYESGIYGENSRLKIGESRADRWHLKVIKQEHGEGKPVTRTVPVCSHPSCYGQEIKGLKFAMDLATWRLLVTL